jgi:hypothetical protein
MIAGAKKTREEDQDPKEGRENSQKAQEGRPWYLQ